MWNMYTTVFPTCGFWILLLQNRYWLLKFTIRVMSFESTLTLLVNRPIHNGYLTMLNLNPHHKKPNPGNHSRPSETCCRAYKHNKAQKMCIFLWDILYWTHLLTYLIIWYENCFANMASTFVVLNICAKTHTHICVCIIYHCTVLMWHK